MVFPSQPTVQDKISQRLNTYLRFSDRIRTRKLTIRSRDGNKHRFLKESVSSIDFRKARAEVTSSEYDDRTSGRVNDSDLTHVTVITPAGQESWDVGLEVCFPDKRLSFYVFLDLKSRKEEVKGRGAELSYLPADLEYFPLRGSHFKHMKMVMEGYNFVYIDMAVHDVVTQVVDECI